MNCEKCKHYRLIDDGVKMKIECDFICKRDKINYDTALTWLRLVLNNH